MGVTDGESRNLSDLIKTNKRVCDDQSRGLMKMMELMNFDAGQAAPLLRTGESHSR
jgi:hypothetical protein